MDADSLQRLEWPQVVEHLVACAATRHGQDRCRAVDVLIDAREVADALELTQEARDLARMTNGFPFGGIRDLREPLRRVAQGGALDASSLVDVAETLVAARRVRDYLGDHAQDFPRLGALADPLAPLPKVVGEIRRCLDAACQVKDDASPELARIRRTVARLQNGIKTETQRLLGTLAEYLQDHLVTVRGDRYVLPVRAEHKNRVPGLVHDQSASGQTLFIEPMSLVELNNDLAKARLDERDEIARILESLTALVGGHLAEIQATDAGLAESDFCAARARLSDRWDGRAPRLGDRIRFYQARHPALVEARIADPARPLVPGDLVIDAPALVVTGPNTGGKTVALKTLGLCTLLTQAGIHPPVGPGSEAMVFERVFADIGDEQDIAQNLSTFSGHMRNLIRLLDAADSRSLVLLDELGAGTDPAEGAALARAVIETLIDRGARVAATTHLAELKLLAYQSVGVQNASVEFDPATMQPTFRLLLGVPGHSNAIAIARRLGFPAELADRAQTYLESGAHDATRLMGALSQDRQEAESLRLSAAEALRRAEAMRDEYEARLAGWQDERKRLKREAQTELREAIAKAHAEVKEAIAELKGQRTGRAAQSASDRLRALAERLRPETAAASPPASIRVGDVVFLPRLGQSGIVQAGPDPQGEVVLQVGRIRVTARMTELAAPPSGHAAKSKGRQADRDRLGVSPAESAGRKAAPDHRHVGAATGGRARTPANRTDDRRDSGGDSVLRHTGREVDLRGMAVHEALAAVEKYLDGALHQGIDGVVVIHGAGTGALRRAVREYLGGSPYARSFRPGGQGEGGDGVTIVNLK